MPAVVYIWLFAFCLFLIVAAVQMAFIAAHNPQIPLPPLVLLLLFLNWIIINILSSNLKNVFYFFSFVDRINKIVGFFFFVKGTTYEGGKY